MSPPDESTLHGLLGRIALQDRQALRQLYELCGGRLLAIAQRTLDDRAAAEDVVQEAFVTIWQRAAQFPVLRTSPLAWLSTLVRHRAIDHRRRRRPEVPLQWTGADGEEHAHDVADDGAGPVQRLIERQDELRLGHCLGTLASDPRQALALAYYEGLTHEEVAHRIGRPLGTVKAWVRRSLGRLKDCLGEAA